MIEILQVIQNLYLYMKRILFYWFFVLFVLIHSGTVSASETEKKYSATSDLPPSGSSGISKAVSPLPTNSSEKSVLTVPDGFILRRIKKGESLSQVCETDSSCMVVFMKVNRLDNRHFPIGRNAFVPVDLSKAMFYVPVPKTVVDSRGVREIRIFLDRQYFGAYENGQLVFWGPVSSGKKDKRTPPGKFFVNYKQRTRYSVKYEHAPMPFSLNYHNGYFIHQQSLPGYPASHGCVRLLPMDAERLFLWSHPGDPVTLLKE